MYGFQRTLSLVEAYRVNGLLAFPTRSTAQGGGYYVPPLRSPFIFNSWDKLTVGTPWSNQQNIYRLGLWAYY